MIQDITYTEVNGILIPNIETSDKPVTVGKYGNLRKEFLRNEMPELELLLDINSLYWKHIQEVDEEANRKMEQLIPIMAEKYHITEALKQENQMEWVRQMNNIKAMAEEIVIDQVVTSRTYPTWL